MPPLFLRCSLVFLLSVGSFAACAQQPAPQSTISSDDAAVREQLRKRYEQMGRTPSEAELDLAMKSFKDAQARVIGNVMAITSSRPGSVAMPPSSIPATPAAFAAPATVPAISPAPAGGAGAMSDRELRQHIERWPNGGRVMSVSRMRDGLEINGQPLIDPEGRISQYAFDEASGHIGYIVEAPNREKVIKVSRIGSASPLRVGSIVRADGSWAVRLPNGQAINGDYFSVQPTGVLVARDGSIFLYQAGKGVASYSVPRGYIVAPLQRGNIESTGYVLLERENAAGSPLSSLQAIGKHLGANAKEDYALMRLSDSRLIPLDVEADSKMQSRGVNCRKRNAVINECSQMVSFESLWNDLGTRSRHYFWRIDWLPTKLGPVAVVNEGKVIHAIQLDSGARVPLFQRSLGIGDFDVVRSAEGIAGVRAKIGFSYENIPDLVAAMQNPSALPPQAAGGNANSAQQFTSNSD